MSKLAIDDNTFSIQCLRPATTDDVAVSGTAAPAAAVASHVKVLRIVANIDVFYSINTTATTADIFLPARSIEYIRVQTGDVLSFIAGAPGTAYVTEMI